MFVSSFVLLLALFLLFLLFLRPFDCEGLLEGKLVSADSADPFLPSLEPTFIHVAVGSAAVVYFECLHEFGQLNLVLADRFLHLFVYY